MAVPIMVAFGARRRFRVHSMLLVGVLATSLAGCSEELPSYDLFANDEPAACGRRPNRIRPKASGV
jgi:hypothetical protein